MHVRKNRVWNKTQDKGIVHASLRRLQALAPNFQPSGVMIDYEDGFILALKEVYGQNLHIELSKVGLVASVFSKAFDTVRHYTLLEKIAMLDIPDTVYNWLVDFFSGHSHNTSYGGATSTIKFVSASIIQGSAIGPISYTLSTQAIWRLLRLVIYSANMPMTLTSSCQPPTFSLELLRLRA